MKMEKLEKDVLAWEKAQRIKRYLYELKAKDYQLDGLPEWVDWIEKFASSIDPLSNQNKLVWRDALEQYGCP